MLYRCPRQHMQHKNCDDLQKQVMPKGSPLRYHFCGGLQCCKPLGTAQALAISSMVAVYQRCNKRCSRQAQMSPPPRVHSFSYHLINQLSYTRYQARGLGPERGRVSAKLAGGNIQGPSK